MKKKQVFFIVLILVLISAAVAAVILVPKLKNNSSKDSSTAEEAAHKIKVWHQFSSNDEAAKYMEELAAKLNEQHDGFVLEVENYSGKDMRNALLDAKKNNSLPDIVLIEPGYLPELARLGILSRLDENPGNYMEIRERLLDDALDSGLYGGYFYGLPFSISTQSLIYNPQLFQTAGASVPATIEEMAEAARSVHGLDDNIYGFGVKRLDAESLAPFIWSNGGTLLNGEQTKAEGFINSKENAHVLGLFTQMAADGSIYEEEDKNGSLADELANGHIAMVMADTHFINELESKHPDFKYESMAVPSSVGQSCTTLGSLLIAIPEKEDMGIGWEFAKTLTDESIQTEFFSHGVIPANKRALESSPLGNTIALGQAYARPLPNSSQWLEMNNEFALIMKKISGGYKSPGEGLDDIAAVWDAMLP